MAALTSHLEAVPYTGGRFGEHPADDVTDGHQTLEIVAQLRHDLRHAGVGASIRDHRVRLDLLALDREAVQSAVHIPHDAQRFVWRAQG